MIGEQRQVPVVVHVTGNAGRPEQVTERRLLRAHVARLGPEIGHVARVDGPDRAAEAEQTVGSVQTEHVAVVLPRPQRHPHLRHLGQHRPLSGVEPSEGVATTPRSHGVGDLGRLGPQHEPGEGPHEEVVGDGGGHAHDERDGPVPYPHGVLDGPDRLIGAAAAPVDVAVDPPGGAVVARRHRLGELGRRRVHPVAAPAIGLHRVRPAGGAEGDPLRRAKVGGHPVLGVLIIQRVHQLEEPTLELDPPREVDVEPLGGAREVARHQADRHLDGHVRLTVDHRLVVKRVDALGSHDDGTSGYIRDTGRRDLRRHRWRSRRQRCAEQDCGAGRRPSNERPAHGLCHRPPTPQVRPLPGGRLPALARGAVFRSFVQ